MGTKAMEAFDPSDVYCGLGPSGANMVMVDSQSHHPWRYPLWRKLLTVKSEGLLGQQIHMWASQLLALTQQSVMAWAMAHQLP